MLKLLKLKTESFKQIIVMIICLLFLFLYFIYSIFPGKKIVIIGDSLSVPYNIGPKDSWVYLLQQRLNQENYHYKIVNFSVAGDITANGLERLPTVLKTQKPVLTIIELGANDARQGIPVMVIKNNLLKLIQMTKQANSKVILIQMHIAPQDPKYNEKFHQIYPDLAQQEHITLISDFLNHVENQSQLMQSDKLHPVQEAQVIILNNIWPEIKKALTALARQEVRKI